MMDWLIPLQACAMDKWLDGSWKACTFDPTTNLIGGPNFGLMLGGSVILGYYIAGKGDLAIPTVMTMLLAGIMIPVLPAGMTGVAYTIVFLGVVAGLMTIARRYVLEA